MWITSPRRFSVPVTGPTRAVLSGLPEGESGAAATVARMRDLVRAAIRDPSQQIRQTALALVGNQGFVGQVRAIQQWVQTHIRYIHDPPDLELVQTPQYTLQQQAGDCDDQAVLVASLLQSIGHPVRFVAVREPGGPLAHVLAQTLIGDNWAGVETIIPKPLGWMPDNWMNRPYILKV